MMHVMSSGSKRMTGADRREQMLAVAAQLIRSDGVSALSQRQAG
jgi:DNA-binding transcriptional regulator YbjK